MNWERTDIEVNGAGSLLWVDGGLYDVAGGWLRLDGGTGRTPAWASFGDFDTAALAPNGDIVALVDSDGTKALLLEPGGRVIRELNRSWYCATSYRYPLVLFTLPDGRTGVAHCPEHYNQIEIEVAATGERMTAHPDRQPADIFHSRLQVSSDGARLLSAGWLWHPVGVARVFDLPGALADASTLDKAQRNDDSYRFAQSVDAEVAGACFVGGDIVVATSAEELGNDDDLGPLTLARWSTTDDRYLWRHSVATDLGDLVRFGENVLALNGHPRLFDGNAGNLLAEWPDLVIPPTLGSLITTTARAGSAMVAVDAESPRFAVAQPNRVTVLSHTV